PSAMKTSEKSIKVTGSIRRRLMLQLLGVAALLSLLLYFMVRTFAEQSAEAAQDNILAASATSMADELRSEQGQVLLDIPYSALSMLGTISEDRVFYNVFAGGQTLTGYEDLPLTEKRPTADAPKFETFDYRGEPIRTASVIRAVTVEGKPIDVLVTVAQTRQGLEETSARISTTAAALGIGFFLVAGVLSLLAAQSALRPLNRLAQSVARRGPQDMRPVRSEAPSELAPLLDALNTFMDRLRSSLSRTEDFIAEAAHRVRTPLATVRTQAEIALRRVERPENKKALRQMIRAIDESSRSAGQLLDHAMVTFRTDNLDKRDIDLLALAHELQQRLAPAAELKDIHLEVTEDSVSCKIKGDPILLQNAFRNIIDNAIKYSPGDGNVLICVSDGDSFVSLSVTDEGRGFDGAEPGLLKARFSRGTNVDDIVGSGLGLTIAEEVARAHNGRLDLSQNTNGSGACVTFLFPH
ncbi:MAG: sensor histidine kinase, partial [Stappiaceae bacterium]